MSVDVFTEMVGLWTELREGLADLDERSDEAKIEEFLDRVVVLRGVEIQTVYPGLEDFDDEADPATARGTRRSDKIQATMEKLSLPPSASAWRAFADAVLEHVDKSTEDVGTRLEALSAEERADLGERTKVARETLS